MEQKKLFDYKKHNKTSKKLDVTDLENMFKKFTTSNSYNEIDNREYKKKGKWFSKFIICLICVYVGGAFIGFLYNLWHTTLGDLFIVASPFIIIAAIFYGLYYWDKHKYY